MPQNVIAIYGETQSRGNLPTVSIRSDKKTTVFVYVTVSFSTPQLAEIYTTLKQLMREYDRSDPRVIIGERTRTVAGDVGTVLS